MEKLTHNPTRNYLPDSFYQREDVLLISQQLLGKFLFTCIDDQITGGMIIETEAYRGPEDRASHAFGNLRTKRTEVMFQPGGICYVYLCYGIHTLLNVVTNTQDVPHAVLIRGIFPTTGIDQILLRRRKKTFSPKIALGPGALTQALGITLAFNGLSFCSPSIWIEDQHVVIDPASIIAGRRVGVDYAGEDALLPWRYQLNLSNLATKNKTTKYYFQNL